MLEVDRLLNSTAADLKQFTSLSLDTPGISTERPQTVHSNVVRHLWTLAIRPIARVTCSGFTQVPGRFHLVIYAKGSPRLKFGDSVIPTLGSE